MSNLTSRLDRVEAVLDAAPVNVRPGKMRDAKQIVALARRVHAETIDADLGYDEDRVLMTAKNCLDPKRPEMGIVATIGTGNDERIVGFIYATGGPHFFAPVAVASCLVFYVVPEMRGTMVAFALLRSFIRRAVSGGASIIMVQVLSGIRLRATHRFLTKVGFADLGGNYMLRLNAGPNGSAPTAKGK